MSRKLRFLEVIDFDTEKHIKGPFCWCHPEYSEKENTYFHLLRFDKDSTIKFDKDYHA